MDKRNAQRRRVCAPHLVDKLNLNDFQVKPVQIYSRLSLRPMVMGTRETKLVAGEEKCSSGQIWYCSGYRGGEKLSGETLKCHWVGCHRVCYRGLFQQTTLSSITLHHTSSSNIWSTFHLKSLLLFDDVSDFSHSYRVLKLQLSRAWLFGFCDRNMFERQIPTD